MAEIVTGVIVGLFTAAFTLLLSPYLSRKHHIWQARMTAHLELIEGLLALQEAYHRRYRAAVKFEKATEEEKLAARQAWAEAYGGLRRFREYGTLLVSSEALAAFENMRTKLSESADLKNVDFDGDLIVSDAVEAVTRATMAEQKTNPAILGRFQRALSARRISN